LREQVAAWEERFMDSPARLHGERPDTSGDDGAAAASLSDLPDWTITEGQVAHYPLDVSLPLTATFEDGEPAFTVGRIGQAASFDGTRAIHAGNVGRFGYFDKFTISAWVCPEGGTAMAQSSAA
jgi:hypothetical protein